MSYFGIGVKVGNFSTGDSSMPTTTRTANIVMAGFNERLFLKQYAGRHLRRTLMLTSGFPVHTGTDALISIYTGIQVGMYSRHK